jgi:hypothetical protein
MRKLALSIFFVGIHTLLSAQIISFVGFGGKTDVFLQWTLAANSSCSSLQIEWSTDSFFFSPTVIYTYPGICGGSSQSTYSFTHTTASQNSKNYYRIRSTLGFSDIISVSTQLNVKNYRMYPVPFNEESNIFFENPKNVPVRFYLFDRKGVMIYTSELFLGNYYKMLRNGLTPGLYYFWITDMSNVFVLGKTWIND